VWLKGEASGKKEGPASESLGWEMRGRETLDGGGMSSVPRLLEKRRARGGVETGSRIKSCEEWGPVVELKRLRDPRSGGVHPVLLEKKRDIRKRRPGRKSA